MGNLIGLASRPPKGRIEKIFLADSPEAENYRIYIYFLLISDIPVGNK
jgi:hypothetical protein